ELYRSETMNQALENTLREQRALQPVMRPGGPLALVKDIQLGRGTGGYDEDKCPGDEALQVVLVPRDCAATPIKAPGYLRVTPVAPPTPRPYTLPLPQPEPTLPPPKPVTPEPTPPAPKPATPEPPPPGPFLAPPVPISAKAWKPVPPAAELGVPTSRK